MWLQICRIKHASQAELPRSLTSAVAIPAAKACSAMDTAQQPCAPPAPEDSCGAQKLQQQAGTPALV